MKERLSKFIMDKGIKPGRFAEILGVQPSNISHILSGRNKPGFDFIENLLLKFPELSPDWVILGHGDMYRSIKKEDSSDLQESDITASELTSQHEVPYQLDATIEPKTLDDNTSMDNEKETCKPSVDLHDVNKADNNAVDKVIIFYPDGTFSSYTKR